ALRAPWSPLDGNLRPGSEVPGAPSRQAPRSSAGDGVPFAATGSELVSVAAPPISPGERTTAPHAHPTRLGRQDRLAPGAWIRSGPCTTADLRPVVDAGELRAVQRVHQLR